MFAEFLTALLSVIRIAAEPEGENAAHDAGDERSAQKDQRQTAKHNGLRLHQQLVFEVHNQAGRVGEYLYPKSMTTLQGESESHYPFRKIHVLDFA